MTDNQNMFTLNESNQEASNSIFGDTQSVNEDFSDTNPDSLDKVGIFHKYYRKWPETICSSKAR